MSQELSNIVACCIACGRPVPSELIAAGVVKPAVLTRRSLEAATNELHTGIAGAELSAAEDVIDPHAAPPVRAESESPAAQDGPFTPGPAAANGDAAAGSLIEHASDVETPPLAVLGQGEDARTIPATAIEAEWLRDFAARRGRA